MVAIIDYGVGNLFSLKSSLDKIGVKSFVTSSAEEISNADKIILPGVGAFEDAIKKLNQSGLKETIISLANNGKKMLGICLGMQLLFEKSYEYGEHLGLGLIKGEIHPIKDDVDSALKIPHMGWNSLEFKRESDLFKYINDGDFVYFVHSYYAKNCDEFTTAVTDYGTKLTASVQNKNVYGCQFHPEKSGKIGLKILKAFCEIGE